MVQKVAQMAPNYQIWQQCSQVFAIELVFALPSAMDIANQCCQKICKRPKTKKKITQAMISLQGMAYNCLVLKGQVQ